MGLKNTIKGTFILILMFILMVIPVTILTTMKWAVILFAKLTRKDLVSLNMSDIVIANIGLLLRVEGEIGLEELQTKFTQVFLGKDETTGEFTFERFHYELVQFGWYGFFKKTTDLNINDHIYVKHLAGNETLEELVSSWNISKYKENSPAWELIIVPLKLKENGMKETAIALKIHHGLADTYSLLYILDKLTGNSSPYLVQDFNESCCQVVQEMLEAPSHFGLMGEGGSSNPLVCSIELETPWTMAFTRLDLNILKAIRRKHGTHITPIFMTLIVGAFRRYLQETRRDGELPEAVSIGISLPWPKHPSKIPDNLENKKICNHWSMTAIINILMREQDPIKRLVEADKKFSAILDSSLDKFGRRFLFPIIWTIPVPLFKGIVGSITGAFSYNTNIVGGRDYKLLGRPVMSIHSCFANIEIGSPIPFTVFTFSHDDHLELTISCNQQVFKDRESLNRVIFGYLPNELKNLANLSGV